MSNKCTVRGCRSQIEIKLHKLCRGHYMRYRSKGDPGGPFIPRKTRLKVYEPNGDEIKMEEATGDVAT